MGSCLYLKHKSRPATVPQEPGIPHIGVPINVRVVQGIVHCKVVRRLFAIADLGKRIEASPCFARQHERCELYRFGGPFRQ